METQTKIIGQYSEDEFKAMISEAGQFRSNLHYSEGTATITYGNTTNYYIQHEDRSWTNYDCKTKY